MDYEQIRFSRDAFGHLLVTLPGSEPQAVEPVRCFPHSQPDEHLSLMGSDGHEVLLLPSLAVLGEEARAALAADLAQREFVPVIRRIVHVSAFSPPCQWEVETERGTTRFELDSEDEVRRLGTDGVLVADSHGVRYRINDRHTLDAYSQRVLRRYL